MFLEACLKGEGCDFQTWRMLECKTDLKNPRKTWVKTQGNQGRKLEAREKKQRRVFLNYHEYEIIYYTVLKKKSYLLFQ